MLTGIISAIGTFVVLMAIGWVRQQLDARLPDKSIKPLSSYGLRELSAQGDLDSFWLQEFKIHYVESQEIGHEIAIVANGEMSLTKDWDGENEESARIYLTLHPFEDAYPGTNQIGWCKVTDNERHGKYVEGRLLIKGSIIAAILGELRLNNRQLVRIGGFENEKGNLLITSFDLTPKD